MLKLFKKLFGIIDFSREEKIARAEKRYRGLKLITKILKIEGLETTDGRIPDKKAWYYKLIDLCAKYQVDFPIRNNS